jgi:MinD-like ATPase involved in chromosome partitioning or flagellar assembly
VLLIDGNLAKPDMITHFDLKSEKTLHSCLNHDHNPMEAVIRHPSGLSMIFGNPLIKSFKHEKMSSVMNHLKKNIKADYIIIDSGTHMKTEFLSLANEADETLFVVSPMHMKENILAIKKIDDMGAGVVGVIINNYLIKHKGIEKEIKKPVLGQIPHDRHMHMSFNLSHPVVCSYPNCTISKAFMDIGKRFSEWNRH